MILILDSLNRHELERLPSKKRASSNKSVDILRHLDQQADTRIRSHGLRQLFVDTSVASCQLNLFIVKVVIYRLAVSCFNKL